MFVRNLLTLSKFKSFSAILVAIMINGIQVEQAAAFTANEVVNQMTAKERSTYLAGIVDGLAQARFVKDKPDQTGVKCIYNWYYQGGEKNESRITQWFTKHHEKPANALLYVLIKKECGA